ncbi:AfsR/SARP family transcriptional regulator [Kitasatospora xanthocidica]|uniref:AfsR/SARP family transcriptional regulator n=1 Tax=Kitasatospora xanthocidica TaxID=83382 RepID=A0A372ZNL3_9ACTN|nr:BTAD domain-containing putative transcriptional regulator [Kitasatospora xanthocidica]RGD56837.1 AfsR/SARP family transcriptional regulator [Kitasatospora xanthocidica]
MTIELRVLSTVSCRGEEVTAPGLRGLLALLAGEVRAGCGRGRLVDGLWPEGRPERPEKALQVLVSRARAKFGAELIASTPTGYRLGLGEERVDASAVLLHAAACAEKARAGDHAGALAEAEAGLELWDGDSAPAEPEGTDPVSALRAERARTHRVLRRARALALARTGRHAAAVEALAEEAAGQPRDEEVLLELLRCEARTAGAAAALGRYDRYRRGLRDALGADPGPELRALQQELLQGAAAPVRRGVPHEPNPLVGREADLAAVAELLGTARVVSVVGPGGLGKTRVAAAVARGAAQRVVHLVPLAGVAADQDVAGAVAAALGAGDRAGIAGALAAGPVLLVLDNCEQVVRGVADLVHTLVAARPDLRVLTTSRTPLGISAESVYLLPELDGESAVELFTQRARAARPDVELPAGPVAELCARLDGLPLALELAAARVRVLAVPEIADRLADRFALLRGGPRDAPQRHRTLQAVVDWSWNLLDPPGRAALRALSVFPGGFTARAAGRLLDDPDVLTVLEDLVDQSLLRLADTPSGGRFRMLETVREFGAAERTKAAEDEAVTARFLLWAREFGIDHHDGPFGPAAVPEWRLVRAEQDNLVRALRLALAAGDGPAVAAIAAVLAGLWTTEGNYVRLLALAEDTGGPVSRLRPGPELLEPVRTLAALSTVNTLLAAGGGLGTGTGALRLLAALRRLPPAAPDTPVRAIATVMAAVPEVLGPNGGADGDPDGGLLAALCAAPEPLLAGVAEAVAGYRWEAVQEMERATASARRTLAAFETLPVPWLRVLALARLGELHLQGERGAEALPLLGAAMAELDRLGDWNDMLGLRWGMVIGSLQAGDPDGAEHWLELAVRHQPAEAAELPAPELGVRAELALARGEVDAGLALWRRSAELLARAAEPPAEPSWALEPMAACVAAHARYGESERVAALAASLPERLVELLGRPAALVEGPLAGALLLALGLVALDRGGREGDPERTRTGVRLVVLAERFRCLRTFQPTMGSAAARADAERADLAEYRRAVAAYGSAGSAPADRSALAAEARRLVGG